MFGDKKKKRHNKSARGVVEVSVGHEIIVTFAGPRRWGHVGRAGCLSRSASGAWSRLVGLVFGWRWGRTAGCLGPPSGLLYPFVAMKTFLHVTDASFEFGKLLGGLADIFASVAESGGQSV